MSEFMAKIYKRVDENPWQTLGDETIIISPKDHFSHEVDGVGSSIWSKINGQTPLVNILDHICSEFEVARDVAEEDLIHFIQDLEQRGLVTCLS